MTNTIRLNSNLVEMNSYEMMQIEGGVLVKALGMTLACTMIAVTPVVTVACPPAGIAIGLTGAGLLGKTTGLY
jgi:hypothetical protein